MYIYLFPHSILLYDLSICFRGTCCAIGYRRECQGHIFFFDTRTCELYIILVLMSLSHKYNIKQKERIENKQ